MEVLRANDDNRPLELYVSDTEDRITEQRRPIRIGAYEMVAFYDEYLKPFLEQYREWKDLQAGFLGGEMTREEFLERASHLTYTKKTGA